MLNPKSKKMTHLLSSGRTLNSPIRISFLFLFTILASHVFAQDITFDVLQYKGGYNISCHGLSNGHIDATIVGGTAPYTYSWSNGATTQDLSAIPAGSYTLTVTDSLGQTDTKSITLYQPNTMSTTLSPSSYGGYNISIHGHNNGNITTDITGGAPPYTYSWNTGSTQSHINNLYVGTYSVTVTDENACTSTQSTTLTEPAALQVSISLSHHDSYNLNCYSGSDGEINLTVSGGVPPYYYDYGTGNGEDNQNDYLHNLPAGDYYISVSDNLGAYKDSLITLTQPPAFTVTLSSPTFGNGHNTACNGCSDGSAEVASVSGGVHPYTYLWTGGTAGNLLSNIGAGIYTLTATDSRSCTAVKTITLTEPAPNDWSKTGSAADSTNFLGTTNSTPLILKTAGTTRMRITTDGDVGIGTNTPIAKLDVNGDLRATGDVFFGGSQRISYIPATGSTPAVLRFGGLIPYPGPTLSPCFSPTLSVNQFAGLLQSFGTNSDGGMMNVLNMGFDGENGVIDVAGTSNGSSPILRLNYQCGKDVDICTGSNGGNIHLTTPTTGNVGVGVDNPTEKLDLGGNVKLNSNTIYLKNDTYHGLKYSTSFSSSTGPTMDGPVLFGYSNGALGTTGAGEKTALFWDNSGNIGIGTGITPPIAKLEVKDGSILFHGTGTTPTEGPGTRMMWIPSKNAFRAGEAVGIEWDDAEIGSHSAAFGYGVKASGGASFAIGTYNTASGAGAIVGGYANTASGNYSCAFGQSAIAQSYASFVIGRYNKTSSSYNASSWIATDPIFIVGNGSPSSLSDAFIVLKNGNSGVGTNSPEDLLQVGKDLTKVVMGSAYGADLGYGTSYIGLNASRQSSTWSTGTDTYNNGGSVIIGDVSGGIAFSTIPVVSGGAIQTGIPDATIRDNTKLYIASAGGVGVNTRNIGAYQLAVNGDIHAKKVVVDLVGWGDFVFYKDYKLKSLKEVESFISKNGHLPEFPTAKEIETNGADLGELLKLQMQKIEELTLYIIEQNKRIELLESQR
ncbi:MAG: large protein [Bacteroidetes bacterium]|nr:large protein [Bacteroidota bacterium]